MAPAEGELHGIPPSQHLVAAISVDLQHPAEAGKMGDRSLGLAVWRIEIDHAGWIAAAPWPIVPRISEELPGLGSPAPGIKHGRGRFVGKELGRRL